MACTIPGCSSRAGVLTKNNEKLSFHRFPIDQELKKTWLINIRRGKNWCPSQYTRICSLHFEDSCFREGYGRRCLHSTAVPTIFPNVRSRQMKACLKRKLVAKTLDSGACTSTPTAVKNYEKRLSVSLPKKNHATQTENYDERAVSNELQKKTKLLYRYKELAVKRGRELKNVQRKCSRLSQKIANLEIIIIALYEKMESEHVEI